MIELGTEFFERCARQQKFASGAPPLHTLRHLYALGLNTAHASPLAEGPYRHTLGHYWNVSVVDAPNLDPDQDSVEVFLARRIRHSLDQDLDRPVIALDAGGGAAMSWLKLAGAFGDDIKDGRLILAASMLKGGPEQYLDEAARQIFAKKTRPKYALQEVNTARKLFKAFGRRVCYITTFANQGNVSLDWHGEEWPLDGETDIVHENNGPTPWSRIPEWHVTGLGSLVSREGIYMVPMENISHPTGNMSLSERKARIQGIQAAHQAFTDLFDLTPVDVVEAGSRAGYPLTYRIFKGSEAAPITVG